MAVYQYQAVTPQGETRSGDISAGSEQEAVSKIQLMELMVIQVSSKGASVGLPVTGLSRKARRKLRHDDIIDLTRQLAVLMGAGLSLDRSLEVIHSVCSLPSLAALVAKIQESVRGGDSLSTAMAKFPEYFSDFYINFIHAAEHAGSMGNSLQDLSAHLDKAQTLREPAKISAGLPSDSRVCDDSFALTNFCLCVTRVCPDVRRHGCRTAHIYGVHHGCR